MTREQLAFALPWLASVLTIWMTYLQGDKKPMAWIVGLVNQVVWLAFALTARTWGLLLLNGFLWYLYTRNYRKWRREAQGVAQRPEWQPFICEARQFADQMVCAHCRTVWDVNDPRPPACPLGPVFCDAERRRSNGAPQQK